MEFIVLFESILDNILMGILGMGLAMWMANQYIQAVDSADESDEDIINDVYDGRDQDTDGIDRLRE